MADFSSLFDLLNKPENQRPKDWELIALDLLPSATLRLLSHQPQNGPDGWPYLMVECVSKNSSPATGETHAATSFKPEPALDVLKWLADRGIGLAINPSKDTPDLVLPYGPIWYYFLSGKFLDLEKTSRIETLELNVGEKLLAGPPSPEYLPDQVRKIVRQFLFDQGVLKPKVLVLTKDRATFDLAFSSESLGLPLKSEEQGILEALSWFLPGHYSLVLLSERDIGGFVDL